MIAWESQTRKKSDKNGVDQTDPGRYDILRVLRSQQDYRAETREINNLGPPCHEFGND